MMIYKAKNCQPKGVHKVDNPLAKVDKCLKVVNYVNRNVNQKQTARLTPIDMRHRVLTRLSTLSTLIYIKLCNSKNVVYTCTYHAYFTRARENIPYKSFPKTRLTKLTG